MYTRWWIKLFSEIPPGFTEPLYTILDVFRTRAWLVVRNAGWSQERRARLAKDLPPTGPPFRFNVRAVSIGLAYVRCHDEEESHFFDVFQFQAVILNHSQRSTEGNVTVTGALLQPDKRAFLMDTDPPITACHCLQTCWAKRRSCVGNWSRIASNSSVMLHTLEAALWVGVPTA